MPYSNTPPFRWRTGRKVPASSSSMATSPSAECLHAVTDATVNLVAARSASCHRAHHVQKLAGKELGRLQAHEVPHMGEGSPFDVAPGVDATFHRHLDGQGAVLEPPQNRDGNRDRPVIERLKFPAAIRPGVASDKRAVVGERAGEVASAL